jgi:hypothetical protein
MCRKTEEGHITPLVQGLVVHNTMTMVQVADIDDTVTRVHFAMVLDTLSWY